MSRGRALAERLADAGAVLACLTPWFLGGAAVGVIVAGVPALALMTGWGT